MMDERWTMFYV